MQSLGLGVQGAGFTVEGLGCWVQGAGSRVKGSNVVVVQRLELPVVDRRKRREGRVPAKGENV